MKIGVLALQGAVREHIQHIEALGATGVAVKRPRELDDIAGLIIPGGESTAIGKLMVEYDFIDAVRAFGEAGKPVYGTCAGMILLAQRIAEGDQPLLGLMDIEARRNAFGRQRESFEANLDIAGIGPFRAVFIRAPWIEAIGEGVQTLAEFDNIKVMARQNQYLVSAFHPELTGDVRIHKYFLDMIEEA
ncbi:MAG: glutamine amidotransferase subunit PdxT [Candidatus Aquicultor primus]|uniref:Pyridoxal 5'-phosphate synthase subunit PdxT n=1 Tax=Candidatus Aquicultor primus TaxID=1797195 RepID=A0A1F2UGV3_9ACTN|nr:MAG: glutamine amidotransferase subunit PdxT [Candidatus Aquicultor primus]